MNEHRLTCDQLRLLKQRLLRGDGHDRNGGGLHIAEADGSRRDHTDRGDGVLGVGAGELMVCDTEDFDARLQCRHRRADGFDSA